MLGVNENNVDNNEDLDAESSSMPNNDKYRIHMDGDNIYVIYASSLSQSKSSSDISVNSKIDTSAPKIPIVPLHKLQSQSYQIEYNNPQSLASFPSVIQTQPLASLSSSSYTLSSHFLLSSSFKTVVQPESIKTYRAGSEDDSGNYLLNLHDTKNLNRCIL